MKTAPSELVDKQRVAWLTNRHFAVRITCPTPQDQRGTGRCWLFALSNYCRVVWRCADLSVSFLAFHDAVEKVRKFLQLCREWQQEDIRGPLLMWLLDDANVFAGF